jgi:hypothetical protein
MCVEDGALKLNINFREKTFGGKILFTNLIDYS